MPIEEAVAETVETGAEVAATGIKGLFTFKRIIIGGVVFIGCFIAGRLLWKRRIGPWWAKRKAKKQEAKEKKESSEEE